MQVAVGVTTAVSAAWYVVQVVDAPNVERDVAAALYECEIAARIVDDRKFDEFTAFNTHGSFRPCSLFTNRGNMMLRRCKVRAPALCMLPSFYRDAVV